MKKHLVRFLMGGILIFGMLLIITGIFVLAQSKAGLYVEVALIALFSCYFVGYALRR